MNKSPETRRVEAVKRKLKATVRETIRGMLATLSAIMVEERAQVRLKLYQDILSDAWGMMLDETKPLREQAVQEMVAEDIERERKTDN